MKKQYPILFFLLISIFLFSGSAFSQDETLTLTTYYPSPIGVYQELRSQRMAIGDTYYDNSLYSWGVEIDEDADLVVEGNVGIGTITPEGELHIKETGNSHIQRPRFIMEESKGKKFDIRMKSVTDDDVRINIHFPFDENEPSWGMFMQIDKDQNIRLLGDVNIMGSSTRPDSTGLTVAGDVSVDAGVLEVDSVADIVTIGGRLVLPVRISDPASPLDGEIWVVK